MTQCQKYPAETGAGHYYFSLLVPTAACLLNTGGLIASVAVTTSYVSSAHVYEGAWICIFHLKDYLHFHIFNHDHQIQHLEMIDDTILIGVRSKHVWWSGVNQKIFDLSASPSLQRASL